MENYIKNHTKIYTKEVKLHKEIPDDNLRLYYNDGWNILNIIDVNDIENYQQQTNFLDISTIPKTIYTSGVLRYIHWRNENIVYPYLNYKTFTEMSNDPIKAIRLKNMFIAKPTETEKSITISLLEKIDGKYFISIYFNNETVQRILNSKRDGKRYIFYELVSTYQKKELLTKCLERLKDILLPATYFPNIILPCHLTRDYILNETSKLFGYQVSDVNYMRKIESNIKSGSNILTFKHSPTIKIADGLMLFYDSFIPETQVADITRSIEYYGGNIISEVGLGKTIIVLYHSLYSNVSKRYKYDVFVELQNTCNYFYKRNNLRGMSCRNMKISDDGLFCKKHCKSIFVDKRVLNFINLNKFDAREFIQDDLIRTNSTLIVCPNQLCDQWVKEYYSKFNPNRRIVMIVTKDQLTNITLGDLLFSDIVIVSYSLLTSQHYKEKMATNIKNKSSLIKDFKNQKSGSLLKSQSYNTLDLYMWNRVVLDEAHEIQNMKLSKQVQYIISEIKCDFKWNVTGTPFANGLEGFLKLLSYNTSYNPLEEYIVKNIYNNPSSFWETTNISDLLRMGVSINMVQSCKILFRRNTKQSTKVSTLGHTIQTINNYVHILQFTDQERILYDSYAQQERKYADFLIKLCCHCDLHEQTKTLVKNCKTLDEIQYALLYDNRERLLKLEKEIKMLQNALNDTSADISSIKKSLSKKEKDRDNTKSVYTYMNSVVENILSDEPCPVCLEDIPKDLLCVTKCGHKYCWNCISGTQKYRGGSNDTLKCPTCNQLVNLQEIYLLSDKHAVNNINDNSLQELIMKVKSTKVGNIIHFLKTFPKEDDKIILFSQWDEMLHKVGNYLTQNNINVVYCCGTVYQKRNAISRFKKDSRIKVILLSSRNAASGMNLTEANTVIMLEPIYGTSEYRNEIEGQAIGRCARIGQTRPISIHRFIVKDTIEEDILNGTNNLDVRQLLV